MTPVGGAGADADTPQFVVIRPEGRFAVHSHAGNRGSLPGEVLGRWYPYPWAAAAVGVKAAITAAMQPGTFAVPLQLGAPGATAFVRLGLLPKTLPVP